MIKGDLVRFSRKFQDLLLSPFLFSDVGKEKTRLGGKVSTAIDYEEICVVLRSKRANKSLKIKLLTNTGKIGWTWSSLLEKI